MSIMEDFIQNLTAPDEMLVGDIKAEESEVTGLNDHWDAVKQVSDWFKTDEEAQEPYRDEMNEAYKLWMGDHWDCLGYNDMVLRTEDQQQTRPNCVENLVSSIVESLVSEFSTEMEIVDFPVDENDDDAATVMTDLKQFISNKNRIKNERPKWLRWFFLYGTGIWHLYWDEDWQGGRGPNRWKGDIRWRALHPNMFFPDARCRESIDDGIRVHKAVWKPIEKVTEKYPDADILPDTLDPTDFIGDELEDVGAFEELTDQVRVIETWYIGDPLIDDQGQGTGLHIIWWVEGQDKYLDHANYVNYEPGETPSFTSAFVVKQCYPREGNIFGYGEPYFFKQIQIIRNKTAELVLEAHLHQAIGQTFYAPNTLSVSQKKMIEQFGQVPGWWFEVQDLNGILRLNSGGVPASLFQELDRLQRMAENVVGRFDISQGRTPGSVIAFRALDLLNTRAQVRLRSKEESIASGYEEVGANINRLIDRNYDRTRSYRIIGEGDDRKWGRFDPDEHKKVYLYDTNETLPLKQFKQMAPQAFDEYGEPVPQMDEYGQPIEPAFEIYSPELDVTCKVSTTLPSDRLFYMEMAKELLGAQLIDEETFWYVMEHGKFPPFEEMRQKLEERKAMEAQMAQQMMMQQAMGNMPQLPQGQPQLPQGQMEFEPSAQFEQSNVQDLIAQAQQLPDPTVDDVMELLKQQAPEALNWYDQQPPEIQQAFIEEIETAMGGEV